MGKGRFNVCVCRTASTGHIVGRLDFRHQELEVGQARILDRMFSLDIIICKVKYSIV